MKRLKKKELLFLVNKFIEKAPISRNAKKHYQSFKIKSVKQSEIVPYQPKAFENPKVVGYKINYSRASKHFT